MSKIKYFGVVLLMGASLAYANAPLSSTYLGLDYLAMASDSSLYQGYAACFSAGCGGEFSATIATVNGTAVNHDGVLANFWCVDSQATFNYGTAGYADVVALSSLTTFPQQVRYSSVTNGSGAGGPFWTDGALPAAAGARYDMAAWLVSQYPGVGANPNNPVLVGGPASDAIQQAIWVIMSNNSPGNDVPFTGAAAQGVYDPSLVDSYIQSALTHYQTFASVSGNDWAVVSWSADAPGGLLNSSNHQTFVVDLNGLNGSTGGQNGGRGFTPEPGFYGVLGLGLSGLFFAVRRRKQA